jgi:hypothetical protein
MDRDHSYKHSSEIRCSLRDIYRTVYSVGPHVYRANLTHTRGEQDYTPHAGYESTRNSLNTKPTLVTESRFFAPPNYVT